MDVKVTNDIIRSRDSIRRKYQLLKRGLVEEENKFQTIFKPITDPLNALIDASLEKSNYEKVSSQKALDNNDSSENYFDFYVTNPKKADFRYGFRPTRNDSSSWMIGSKNVNVSADGIIEIDGTRYKGSSGLFELLTKKKPTGYDKNDLQIYKQILLQTNAHRRDFSAESSIASNRSYKYKNIIRHLFSEPPEQSGEGLFKKFNKSVDLVYWDDPNELVNRLKLLLSSQEAGNFAHSNEIISIIEELREDKLID